MELTRAQQLLTSVIQEAWATPSFKEQLIKEPKAAIEQLTGTAINVPQGKTLVVCDQTDQRFVYVNIPPQTSIDDMELNEAQLEHIAGGGQLFDPILTDPSLALSQLF